MATVSLVGFDHVLKSMFNSHTHAVNLPPPPTWVGKCTMCRAVVTTNDDPGVTFSRQCAIYLRAPDDGWYCSGVVLLLGDWQAALAAFHIGGRAALEPWK